jgi:hypothetical protein
MLKNERPLLMDPCGSSGGVFYQGQMSNLEPSDSQEHEKQQKKSDTEDT